MVSIRGACVSSGHSRKREILVWQEVASILHLRNARDLLSAPLRPHVLVCGLQRQVVAASLLNSSSARLNLSGVLYGILNVHPLTNAVILVNFKTDDFLVMTIHWKTTVC